jgi:phage recombination protein Bet
MDEKALVKYETDSGEVTLSPSIVREYLVNGNGMVTDQEVMMFLGLCRFQKLNPFLREAYLIRYGSHPASIVVGKEAFLKRAAKMPECRGYSAGVICQCGESKEIVRTEGFCPPGCQLIGGWAQVTRTSWDHPHRVEIGLNEYIGRKGDGTINKMWTEKPATMIRKVALVQVLREAFPAEFGGMYSAEEINPVGDLPTTPVDSKQATHYAQQSRPDVIDMGPQAEPERPNGNANGATTTESPEPPKQAESTEPPGRRARRQKFQVNPHDFMGKSELITCGITPHQMIQIRDCARMPELRPIVQTAAKAIGYDELSYFREDEAEALLSELHRGRIKNEPGLTDLQQSEPDGQVVSHGYDSTEVVSRGGGDGETQPASGNGSARIQCPYDGEQRAVESYCKKDCPIRANDGWCPSVDTEIPNAQLL